MDHPPPEFAYGGLGGISTGRPEVEVGVGVPRSTSGLRDVGVKVGVWVGVGKATVGEGVGEGGLVGVKVGGMKGKRNCCPTKILSSIRQFPCRNKPTDEFVLAASEARVSPGWTT